MCRTMNLYSLRIVLRREEGGMLGDAGILLLPVYLLNGLPFSCGLGGTYLYLETFCFLGLIHRVVSQL